MTLHTLKEERSSNPSSFQIYSVLLSCFLPFLSATWKEYSYRLYFFKRTVNRHQSNIRKQTALCVIWMYFDFFDMPLLYLLVTSNYKIEIIFFKVLNMTNEDEYCICILQVLQYHADTFYVLTTY